MLVSRMFVAVLCASALFVGEIRAGQCPGECHATQTPQMTVAVYSVADLVIPVATGASTPYKSLEERLIGLITQAIDPASWSENGGEASIQYYRLGMALVVSQTPSNQEEIVNLLTALRRLQDVEVVIETRVISLPSELAEAFTTLAGFKELPTNGSQVLGKIAFANEQQAHGWSEVFSGKRACEVMQPPKITVFNGQQVQCAVGDEIAIPTSATDADGNVVLGVQREFTGFRANYIPVVSADRKFVRLHLDSTVTAAAGSPEKPTFQTLNFNGVVALPCHGTVICALGKMTTDGCKKCGPPKLSKIPYLNGLFTNCCHTQEDRQLFLMVTTHVLINEENNAKPCDGGCRPCIPR
jgi:Flp pilus assembly secretin CpaC